MTRIRGFSPHREITPALWRAYLRRFANEHLGPQGSTKLVCGYCGAASCGTARASDGELEITPYPAENLDVARVADVEWKLRCRRASCDKESTYAATFVLNRIDEAIRTAQKNARLF